MNALDYYGRTTLEFAELLVQAYSQCTEAYSDSYQQWKEDYESIASMLLMSSAISSHPDT